MSSYLSSNSAPASLVILSCKDANECDSWSFESHVNFALCVDDSAISGL